MSMLMKRSFIPSLRRGSLTSGFDNFDSVFDTLVRTGMFDTFNTIGNFSDQMVSYPKANVLEVDSGYEINVALPGLSRSDISVDIGNGSIIVASSESYQSESDDRFTTREFGFSSFKRTWTIPENANVESISASYESGVLSITIPTSENKESVNRTIQIS